MSKAKLKEPQPDLLAKVVPKTICSKCEKAIPDGYVWSDGRGGLYHKACIKRLAKGKPDSGKLPMANATRSQLPARIEPPAKPKTMLEILAGVAADPRADHEKTRAFLDMQKEIMAEEARIAFIEAFIDLQAELPVISAKGLIEIEGKVGKKGQKTPYATFNEINRVTKPLLRAHGFIMWFEPDVGADGKIIMRGHLDHKRGHGKTCAISLPLETSGSKNNVQGVGSSISYGKRYAAIALLNLTSEAPEDADLNGKTIDAGPTLVSEKQIAELKHAIEDCGVGEETFRNKYEVEKLADLPIARFAEAIGACVAFKKAQAAARAQKDGA